MTIRLQQQIILFKEQNSTICSTIKKEIKRFNNKNLIKPEFNKVILVVK